MKRLAAASLLTLTTVNISTIAQALDINSDDFETYLRRRCASGINQRQCLMEAKKVGSLLAQYARKGTSGTAQTDRRKPSAGPNSAAETTQAATKQTSAAAKKSDALSSTVDKFFPPTGNTQFVVAKNFVDLGILGSFDPTKASGATISYSDDRVAQDSFWTMQGIGTIGYNLLDHDTPMPPLYYMQVGIYGGVNKITNTNVSLASKSVDNTIWGGFSEMQFKSSPEFHHWFRVTAGGTTNDIATRKLFTLGKTTLTTTEAATQFAISAEYLPVWDLGSYVAGPLSRIVGWYIEPLGAEGPRMQLQPSVLFQYNNTFDSTNILAFSGRKYSERLGPQASLVLYPFPNPELLGLDNLGLDGLFIKTSYHWYHEFAGPRINYVLKWNNYSITQYSGQSDYVFNTSLNYPITKSIKISASYQRGVDENAGKGVNVFLIGLSGLLCGGKNCQTAE